MNDKLAILDAWIAYLEALPEYRLSQADGEAIFENGEIVTQFVAGKVYCAACIAAHYEGFRRQIWHTVDGKYQIYARWRTGAESMAFDFGFRTYHDLADKLAEIITRLMPDDSVDKTRYYETVNPFGRAEWAVEPVEVFKQLRRDLVSA